MWICRGLNSSSPYLTSSRRSGAGLTAMLLQVLAKTVCSSSSRGNMTRTALGDLRSTRNSIGEAQKKDRHLVRSWKCNLLAILLPAHDQQTPTQECRK